MRQKYQKKNFILQKKKTIKIWDVNIDNIVISTLIKTKTSSTYLIGYLDKVIRSVVLVMPKKSGYVRTFKVKDGDKNKNNKLTSFRIDDEMLLETYKTVWTKIEDLKNIELNALPAMMIDIAIKFILTLVASMCQKMIKNANLLQLFLLILYLYMKTNITLKYI